MRQIELVSPLPPDECAARLREAIDREGLPSWFGSKPVVGRVSGRSVRLCKRIRYSNPLHTFLSGTLEPHGEGTVFRGTAGVHPFVTAFLVVWFAALILLGVVGAFCVLVLGNGQPGILLIFPLLAVLGVAWVGFGRYLARGEEQFLVAFLAEVLGARGEAQAETAATDRPRV